MRTLQLTTWERVSLVQLISAQRGDLAMVRRFLRLLDVLELTEEERALVGWQSMDSGRAAWTDAGHVFDLELEDADFELLKSTALGWGSWQASALTVEMLEKLIVKKH